MRSASLAVVRSYFRPLTLVVPGMFVVAMLFLQTGGRPLVESSPKHLVRVVFHFLSVLTVLGVLLVAHLKQMLGSNVAQLVPRLHRGHLTFAAGAIAAATILLPAVLCSLTGNTQSILPMIAVCLVTLTIVVTLTNCFPSFSFLITFAPAYLAIFGSDFWLDVANRLPGAAGSTLLIAFPSAALYWQGRRLACFNEEFPEFHWRVPVSSTTQRGTAGSPWHFGGKFTIAPELHNLRQLKMHARAADESVIELALHLNAAWRPFWGALFIGSMIGAMNVAFYALFSGRGGNPYFPMSPMSFIGVMPAMFVCHPAGRAFVVQRMMWPYSRKQFVQGLGLLLAMACAFCWLIMQLIPLVSLILFFGVNPLTQDSVRWLTLSAAAMPLYFGLFTRPWRSFQLVLPILFIGLFVGMGFFAADMTYDWDWLRIAALPSSVFAIGCGVSYWSYRRWLADDVD